MRFLTTVLLVSLTAVPVAQAQSRTMWGFISLGPGAAADSGFYASGIGFGTQRGRRLIMARISSLATPNTKRISDVGVLVGVASAPRRFSFGAAGGLGVATDVKDSAVVALPIEAHASWIMNQNAAIGLRLFGSVNGLANFSGINLNIQIGRLRN